MALHKKNIRNRRYSTLKNTTLDVFVGAYIRKRRLTKVSVYFVGPALTRSVTNWCTPDQRLRWASFAALTAERRMNKLHNHKHTPTLAKAISDFLRKSKRSKDS
ncbi:MAG: hypothetical protein HYX66_09190 [Ignavibacteria bacterium]|nr:hypothetical protein [Ignavibacteria bacterium]